MHILCCYASGFRYAMYFPNLVWRSVKNGAEMSRPMHMGYDYWNWRARSWEDNSFSKFSSGEGKNTQMGMAVAEMETVWMAVQDQCKGLFRLVSCSPQG